MVEPALLPAVLREVLLNSRRYKLPRAPVLPKGSLGGRLSNEETRSTSVCHRGYGGGGEQGGSTAYTWELELLFLGLKQDSCCSDTPKSTRPTSYLVGQLQVPPALAHPTGDQLIAAAQLLGTWLEGLLTTSGTQAGNTFHLRVGLAASWAAAGVQVLVSQPLALTKSSVH